MLENLDQNSALEFVLEQLKKDSAFAAVEESELQSITRQVMEADMLYMKRAEEENEGVYDEDEAYDFILNSLTPGLDEENKALVSLVTDGYLEYFDQYLEDNDLIDWE